MIMHSYTVHNVLLLTALLLHVARTFVDKRGLAVSRAYVISLCTVPHNQDGPRCPLVEPPTEINQHQKMRNAHGVTSVFMSL